MTLGFTGDCHFVQQFATSNIDYNEIIQNMVINILPPRRNS